MRKKLSKTSRTGRGQKCILEAAEKSSEYCLQNKIFQQIGVHGGQKWPKAPILKYNFIAIYEDVPKNALFQDLEAAIRYRCAILLKNGWIWRAAENQEQITEFQSAIGTIISVCGTN